MSGGCKVDVGQPCSQAHSHEGEHSQFGRSWVSLSSVWLGLSTAQVSPDSRYSQQLYIPNSLLVVAPPPPPMSSCHSCAPSLSPLLLPCIIVIAIESYTCQLIALNFRACPLPLPPPPFPSSPYTHRKYKLSTAETINWMIQTFYVGFTSILLVKATYQKKPEQKVRVVTVAVNTLLHVL